MLLSLEEAYPAPAEPTFGTRCVAELVAAVRAQCDTWKAGNIDSPEEIRAAEKVADACAYVMRLARTKEAAEAGTTVLNLARLGYLDQGEAERYAAACSRLATAIDFRP